ncbi:MAG: hypothetical protein ACAI44_21280 [Candidatus Sericytochromatia bacterium]
MTVDRMRFARGTISSGSTVQTTLPKRFTKIKMTSDIAVDFSLNVNAVDGSLAEFKGYHPGQYIELPLEQSEGITDIFLKRVAGSGTGIVYFDLEV